MSTARAWLSAVIEREAGVMLAVVVAARVGRSRVTTGALRVTFWSALAMALTAAIGRLFGVIA